MPTYIYRREDGTTFEIQQPITHDALETCPTTGQAVKRVITGAGLIFKGEGFYITDYARKGNGTAAAASAPSASSDAPEKKSGDSSENGSESKTEVNTGAKSESKPASSNSPASTESKTD